MVHKLTDETFENEVLKSEKPVLVDFNASWCGPCRMMAPVIEEMSEQNTDVKFMSCDVDECQETAREYGVMSIPTIMIFKDGEESAPLIGAQPQNVLEDFIKRNTT